MMAPAPILLAILAMTPSSAAPAQASDPRTDHFKAAMVYNFARFASWPASRFPDTTAPVVLCVGPANPLTAALERLEGQPIGARQLHVRVSQNISAACHLAFVDAADATPAKLATMKSQGVLTVGETPGFSRSGAVGLVTVGRQVRFEINTPAAREAGVVLSSQLLRLAVAVR